MGDPRESWPERGLEGEPGRKPTTANRNNQVIDIKVGIIQNFFGYSALSGYCPRVVIGGN